eukprot:1403933-Amphidinium_carterae.1
MGKICGVVSVGVLDEPDIPLLLPVGLLSGLGLVLDLTSLTCRWTHCIPGPEAQSRVHQLPTGHLAVNVIDFPRGGWRFPSRLSRQEAHKVPESSKTRIYLGNDWCTTRSC